jgi:hypothetical protein
VRAAAGDALVALADERFDLVRAWIAAGLEGGAGRPIEAFDHALGELPYLLAEVDDPGAVDLVLAMLGHGNARVVGAALEVGGELALDDRVRRALARLTHDGRTATFDDGEGGTFEASIGEAASEIVAALGAVGERRGEP